MKTSPGSRWSRNQEPELDLAVDEEELQTHSMLRFAPARSLADNVFSLARPLWGKCRAEWTIWLAQDVVAEVAEADGVDRRVFTAAILWAAAVDVGMDRDERLWAHIAGDIMIATGVVEDCARDRFEQLKDHRLARPRSLLRWW